MTQAFLDPADAVHDEHGVLLHVSEPLREQRRLADGAAGVPRADRVVIAVSGGDRLGWLDSFTSQQVSRLEPGAGAELLVLDPQGRIEHAAAALDDGETTWLIVDRDDADPLVRWLMMMRFRADVAIDRRDDLLVIGFVPGGSAAEAIVPLAARTDGLALVWNDPWGAVQSGGWQYAAASEHPAAGFRWAEAIVPAAEAAGIVSLPVAGVLAAEALRIAAWRPRWSTEVDERAIPHETDWLRTAVHLDKGCYRGQETVAKVHNLGHPPRRLVMLHLDGSDAVLPERGAAVFDGENEVGRVTSAARHHELGPIALAVVSRRARADAPLEVETDGLRIAAAQEIIVPADAGATADVPRLPRLSRRRPAG